MPANSIPERNPIADPFSGVILQAGTNQTLALRAEPGADVIASGHFVARYGVRFLGKPHLAIVPGMLVLDYGDILTGEEGWNFLLKRSNLYPRGEVFGYRNDGRDDMVYVKNLDLALSIVVLVYPDDQAVMPLAQPAALVAGNPANVPPRLLEYLPRYDTVSAWKAALHE